MPTFINHL